jgi:hypothetical protein
MKKFLYLAAIGIALGSCGGGGGDNPTPTPIPTPENKVPTTPTLVAPTNNKLCIDNAVNFQWNASTDPDGDAITYQIQVAKDNQFGQIAHTLSGSATNQSISLEKGVAYYWRVKATDSKSLSSAYSTVFNFYTEGVGETNHLPFSPELVKPDLNSVVQTATATLEWNAVDVDTNDALTFDVYFGTANPPTTKMGDNQTAKTLDVNLEASKSYYWKVVVKDNNGGEAIGQIWNFKTD